TGLQGERDCAPEPLAIRFASSLRLAPWRHLPWRDDPWSAFLRPADARIRRLSHADRRALSLRRGGASRRRRDRSTGTQRCAGGDRGSLANVKRVRRSQQDSLGKISVDCRPIAVTAKQFAAIGG